MKSKKYLRTLAILILLVSCISCDQISKTIVRNQVGYHSWINLVSDNLVLTRVENTGAFLSMGNSLPKPVYAVLMIILPLIVIAYTLWYLFKNENISKLLIIGISLIIGGGLGNIIDRILYGSVTDFLYFDLFLFHTGVVNLADIFVTAGFGVVIYDSAVRRKFENLKI